MRAYWNYFRDVNIFNLAFSIFVGFFAGLIWIPVLFCTFGLLMGLIRFETFLSNQYYFYYNLGYTKLKLAGITLLVNLIIVLPLLLLIALLT